MRIADHEADIVIRNISERGIGASAADAPPTPGSSVSIILPDGQVRAGAVRWVRGRNFGIELTEDLQVEVVALSRPAAAGESQPEWKIKPLHKVHTPRADPARLRRL